MSQCHFNCDEVYSQTNRFRSHVVEMYAFIVKVHLTSHLANLYSSRDYSHQGRRNRGAGGARPHLKVRGHRVCLAPSLFVPE